MNDVTFMRREIGQIPELAARLIAEGRPDFSTAARALRDKDPALIATIARGSSDNVAAYLKYVSALTTGVPVASIGPSIASIYGASMRLDRAVALGVSQSGRSPDIVAMLEAARRGGGLAMAITNAPASPLAQAADHVIDIRAGVEKSVAATKTFVLSLVAGLALIGHWAGDGELLDALERLPDALGQALDCDWSAAADALEAEAGSLFVLGRGPSAAIASEAALKFKETSGLHAEAYSAAEVLHGPAALARRGFCVLALAVRDAAEAGTRETAQRLAGQGARVFLAGEGGGGVTGLPVVRTGHRLTEPLALAVSYYVFIEALARRRGHNPDTPPHLEKITATL